MNSKFYYSILILSSDISQSAYDDISQVSKRKQTLAKIALPVVESNKRYKNIS